MGISVKQASKVPNLTENEILERISALEKELSFRLDLAAENMRIAGELRLKDQEIARKDIEIEKLQRDLIYQKRLLEKEIEDRLRVLDEKRALMDREVSDRVARERDEFEKKTGFGERHLVRAAFSGAGKICSRPGRTANQRRLLVPVAQNADMELNTFSPQRCRERGENR